MSSLLTTSEPMNSGSEPAAAPVPSRHANRWLLPTLGVLGVLVLGGAGVFFRDPLLSVFSKPEPTARSAPADPVVVVAKDVIGVDPQSLLQKRIRIEPVVLEDLKYPRLNVTGYVMARLAPGKDLAERRWDFASPEVATAYSDWLNASKDAMVTKDQLDKTRDIVKLNVDFLKKDWERKKALFPALPERDLYSAEKEFRMAEKQGQRDIRAAEADQEKAERSRGLLERQLLQAGVDPEVVRKATENLVLVVADVPEAKVGAVTEGQPCEANFYGVQRREPFKGKVGRLGPSVNKEKRTLRVTFELENPQGKLLPGMFADIGLGTELRTAVKMLPTEAVLHAGKSDYVLKEEAGGKFRVVEVKVDEPRMIQRGKETVSCVAVLEGSLTEKDRVVGAGAILLKPIMVKALAVAP
jgi:hypothetical protein